MEISFFAMPPAQTWFARTAFKATDTILLTNQDIFDVPSHLPIPSRSRDGEGRPLIAQSIGRFKMLCHSIGNGSQGFYLIYTMLKSRNAG